MLHIGESCSSRPEKRKLVESRDKSPQAPKHRNKGGEGENAEDNSNLDYLGEKERRHTNERGFVSIEDGKKEKPLKSFSTLLDLRL